jgi:phage FluMu gp28-like protein
MTPSLHSSRLSHPSQPYFLPYQQRWIDDPSPLKIIEKSRQIGITYADAYDSVLKAAGLTLPGDVWVSSRDQLTASLYLNHCKRWAGILHHVAEDLGVQIIDPARDITAHVLRFPRAFSIYSLSSSPNALVGKSGHIKLDEFAIHQDQRALYHVAKPCTTWGGQLCIISTHRGVNSVFNEILRSIKESGNPMGWSHHCVTIHDAIAQGLVERINTVTRRSLSRGAFLQQLHAQCLDEEQWLQEFCCQPGDENSAFITYDMTNACEAPGCMKPLDYITERDPSAHRTDFYIGVDVGRKHHLCVIDIGEKIGDVLWDRHRIELHDKPFSEIEAELARFLPLPHVRRICIDSTGIGMQLAERAKQAYPWKVEPVHFSAQVKEELAYSLRTAFEDRKIRIDPDPKLKADLRSLKKLITTAGNIRFAGESDDSHCDRFWAKALRQHAAKKISSCGAVVVYDDDDEPWGQYNWTPFGTFLRSKLK